MHRRHTKKKKGAAFVDNSLPFFYLKHVNLLKMFPKILRLLAMSHVNFLNRFPLLPPSTHPPHVNFLKCTFCTIFNVMCILSCLAGPHVNFSNQA